jgi:hypothetical protein
MDLAIPIVSYQTRDLLRGCLASVYASLARSPRLAAEVWVVDNASSDGSAAMVREEFPQARLVASPDNLGFPAGNNLALQAMGFWPAGAEAPATSGHPLLAELRELRREPPRHVLLLNPDTVVQGDAPAQMAAFLDAHPRAGACGAQLAYPDGRFQHGAFRFPGLAQIAFDFYPPPGRLNRPLLDSRLNGRYGRQAYDAGKPFSVDFVLGAALMVRGEAIRQVGLLDEGYFMYCEEMDWQKRLAAVGWGVFCVPAARVVHVGGASTRQFRGPMLVALWRSRFRYFRRYDSPAFNRLAAWLVRRGVHAEARRARQAALPDLADRLAAYAQIEALATVQLG